MSFLSFMRVLSKSNCASYCRLLPSQLEKEITNTNIMVDYLQQKPHAILVCYPLQGHVVPSVQLAIKLASSGFTITFINTQSIHHQITSKTQQNGHQEEDIFAEARRASPGLDIRYMTVSDGLPVGFDRSLNHDQFMASLLHVFSAHVEEVVLKIVGEHENNVSCLIADTFFVWPGSLAKKYGLLYISFWTEPALVFTLYYHMDLLRSNGHFGCIDAREDSIDYIPGLPRIEPKDLMSYLQTPDVSVTHQLIFKAFRDAKNADMVLCNTVQELEPQVISSIQKRVPFYAIGPLFPTSDFSSTNVAMSLWAESDCSLWLDSQEQGSVLYVSFGSYAHVRKTDLLKIANGIASSNVKFVWVMRPDIVSSDDDDPLPHEFKKGTQDRGVIIQWCNAMLMSTIPTISATSAVWRPSLFLTQRRLKHPFLPPRTTTSSSPHRPLYASPKMNLLGKLGFGTRPPSEPSMDSAIAQGPDDDIPAPGQQFAQFGAGCFWGVELVFQRVPGVTKTEVGYSQGYLHNPAYEDVCSGSTNHNEVVRVQYDPNACSFDSLLDAFWSKHDPTTPNRQGNDVGSQYRSGIYFYTPEQEKAALESLEKQQKQLNRKIVTEIMPAKKFYRAEEYHQQYLAKGGRFGFKQSTEKGCNDPIRCYG